jgi:hypothetical protein
MRLNKSDRKTLEDISREFEGKANFGRILRGVNIELYEFYKAEIYKASRKAFEIGYTKGIKVNKAV